MIYQTIIIVPNWTYTLPLEAGVGFDRLSYSLPYANRDQKTKDLIDSGVLNRYWGPYDSITLDEDNCKVIKMAWNTRQAAEDWITFLTHPSVIDGENEPSNILSTEIVEISD